MSSPEKIREAILLYLDAQDAANTKLRQDLDAPTQKPTPELKFSLTKITAKEIVREDGSKWNLATDTDNTENPDYQELKKFLAQNYPEGRGIADKKWCWIMPGAKAVGFQDPGARRRKEGDKKE